MLMTPSSPAPSETPPKLEMPPPLLTPKPAEIVACALVVLALVALALVRCEMTDTPYHLATARHFFETGHWPTTNTFSWTHPDYPLYQQYPVYQWLLYRVYLLAGWEGLSLFHLAGWGTLFVLWLRWAGAWRTMLALPLVTMILLLGLRERMVLRPDLLTMLYFVVTLILADGYRSGRWWTPLAFPLVTFLWVNSHQMFWVGLVLQGSLIVHRAAVGWAEGRWGVEKIDRPVPWWPLLVGLGLSLGACFLSPLGTRVWEVPMQTVGSLYHHRQNVMEFAPFYTSVQATWLVTVSGLFAVAGFVLGRRRWAPFEVLLWGLGLSMVMGAIRGTPFFVAISLGIFVRGLMRSMMKDPAEALPPADGAAEPAPAPTTPSAAPTYLVPRWGAVLLTVLLCMQVYYHRWLAPARTLEGSQFGLGRNLGPWPDESIEFLRRFPPPGKMINLSWYLGNPLIWELADQQPVFVDPRFETYPRSFLIAALAAETDGFELDRLIDSYQPTWLVGELRVAGIRDRMTELYAAGEWEFVHVDPIAAVMVRRTPETSDYLDDHRCDPADSVLDRQFVGEPDLQALRHLRMAAFLAEMGRLDAARRWCAEITESTLSYPAVRSMWDQLTCQHPEISERGVAQRLRPAR